MDDDIRKRLENSRDELVAGAMEAASLLKQASSAVKAANLELERIKHTHDTLLREVEKEQARLEALQKQNQEFERRMGTRPQMSQAAPTSFQSQYDQFNTTKSNERISSIGKKGVIDFTDKLNTPDKTEPAYSFGDGKEHYTVVDPGIVRKDVYASGYYEVGGKGSKQYEYRLSPWGGEKRVGQTLKAVVHVAGSKVHGGDNSDASHKLDFTITEIYTNPKYFGNEDLL